MLILPFSALDKPLNYKPAVGYAARGTLAPPMASPQGSVQRTSPPASSIRTDTICSAPRPAAKRAPKRATAQQLPQIPALLYGFMAGHGEKFED
jgi:hypothetical protein